MKKLLFILLILMTSCRKNNESYFWYYDVKLRSDHVEATYKIQNGTYKTERIFNGWIYGWGTRSSNSDYDIKLINRSQFGGDMMVRVIRVYYNFRSRDTVDIIAGVDSIRLKR